MTVGQLLNFRQPIEKAKVQESNQEPLFAALGMRRGILSRSNSFMDHVPPEERGQFIIAKNATLEALAIRLGNGQTPQKWLQNM